MKKLLILIITLCSFLLVSCAEIDANLLPDSLVKKKPVEIDSEDLDYILEEIDKINRGDHSGLYEEEVKEPAVLVENEISYTKKIIPIIENDNYYDNKYHEIHIPKINIETDTVDKLNEEIYDKFYPIVRKLEQNEEGGDFWTIKHEYHRHENILSILIDYTYGWQYGEYEESYLIYHYDIENDKVLNYSDYLDVLGISKTTLTREINARNTDTLPYTMTVPYLERSGKNSITDVYFDSENTYVSYTYEHQNYIFKCENILDDITVY